MRRLLTLSAVVVIGGCSLFGFDGFSGGEDPDAGTTPTSDATTGDGPSSSDGEATGTDGDATPSGPFCKTTGADAAVCDDFDEPGTFTGTWSSKDTYLGTLDIIDGAGIGGTKALRFSATPRADGMVGQDGRVVLGYVSPTPAQYVDAELAVKLTSVPTTTYAAAPLYVEWERNDGGRARVGYLLDGARQIAVNPTVFYGDGGVVGGVGKVIATLPTGTWTRIRLVVDLTKTPHSLFAYVDGALKHEMVINEFAPAKVKVFVGAHYVGTEDGGTVGMDLDDARISWK